jgi:hypothetical protein
MSLGRSRVLSRNGLRYSRSPLVKDEVEAYDSLLSKKLKDSFFIFKAFLSY